MIKNLLLLVTAIFVSVFLSEVALYILQYPSHYKIITRIPPMVPYWVCDDDKGNYYTPGTSNTPWPINGDGFLGQTNFTDDNIQENALRVLLLGDSFTWGSSASAYNKSYARQFEIALSQKYPVTVWNTAIGGIGQKQQILSLHKYFPMLQPQLVVLGFYINDFSDNMYPVAEHYVFEKNTFVFRYHWNPEDGTITTLSPEQAYRRAMNAAETMPQYLLSSKVLSLIYDAGAGLTSFFVTPENRPITSNKCCPGCLDVDTYPDVYQTTMELLRSINDYVASNGSRLLLLLIPSSCDLGTPTNNYVAAREICEVLDIEYIEVRSDLTLDDYVPLPDVHWNDSGHYKVAEILSQHILATLNRE